MLIAFLADYPECLPTVAAWIFQEWGLDFADFVRGGGSQISDTLKSR